MKNGNCPESLQTLDSNSWYRGKKPWISAAFRASVETDMAEARLLGKKAMLLE